MKNLLGERMKEYESVSNTFLVKKTPVIIRIDGKAFHTFTRKFQRPFDVLFMETMIETTKNLCENIQGCVLGYVQSDEITLVLTDYDKVETCAWFDYRIQKMCSIAASMATLYFNRNFAKVYENTYKRFENQPMFIELIKAYNEAMETGALFDARCFNLPKEEVVNNLIWRQQDATRNSINMVAQKYFSHKSLQGLSCEQMQEKLFQEKNINWNSYSTSQKRGTCCIKQIKEFTNDSGEKYTRAKWVIDRAIPIFTKDRDYIEKLI